MQNMESVTDHTLVDRIFFLPRSRIDSAIFLAQDTYNAIHTRWSPFIEHISERNTCCLPLSNGTKGVLKSLPHPPANSSFWRWLGWTAAVATPGSMDFSRSRASSTRHSQLSINLSGEGEGEGRKGRAWGGNVRGAPFIGLLNTRMRVY